MTWDGIPEHRNLRGEDAAPPHLLGPEERKAYIKRIIESSGHARPGPESTPPTADGMPADPFNGLMSSSIALAEILHSLIDGGFTEPQALYYLACLSQIRLAMLTGQLGTDLPPWPPEDQP